MSPTSSARPLAEALRLMIAALEILDREKAPGDIGGYLDLAIHRLQDTLASPRPHGKTHH